MYFVFYVYIPFYKKTKLVEPKIETPERVGFVVVEWGGILARYK